MIYTEILSGPAGSGKSYEIQQRVRKDPRYALLSSTTGVSAVNLGTNVTTINSLLGFFDLASLQRSFEEGWLKGKFVQLAFRRYKNIVIDEASMLGAVHLQYIYQGALQAAQEIREAQSLNNRKYRGIEPVGIILTLDLLQLPPVEQPYPIHAPAWKEHFSQNVKKLTGSYRQTNPMFLEALNMARQGKGVSCAILLQKLGVKFVPEPDRHFDGTTLFPTNNQVDKMNRERLAEMEGETYTYRSKGWGKQPSEWIREIPTEIELKVGCKVMILINQSKTFDYVNGDSATVLANCVRPVVGIDGELRNIEYAKIENDKALPVKVFRNGYETDMPWAVRKHLIPKRPSSAEEFGAHNIVDYWGPDYKGKGPEDDPEFWQAYAQHMSNCEMNQVVYEDPLHNGWVVGELRYMPIKIGYALTVHKAQGLSLDRVQLDVRSIMAGKDSLVYVGMSRVRTPEGLVIVGNPSVLAKRICTNHEVKEWV
jgi:ATP-dependent DNA helicase PIF1